MVSTETLPFTSVARATTGQVLLYYLHTIIDGEERERRVHLACLPKLNEIRCEVCGKPVRILEDYIDKMRGLAYSPREYVEHQLNMTPEEKQARQEFFEELFAQADAKKEQVVGNT